MPKKDIISWLAFGLFALAILFFAVTQQRIWLILAIAPYILRPTLVSLGIIRERFDERQLYIYYRSGTFGFVAMIAMCAVLALKSRPGESHDFWLFASVVMVGIGAKSLFMVILSKNFRTVAPLLIIMVGLMVALFPAMDAGSFAATNISAFPGIALIGIGLLALKFPKPIGIIVIVAAASAIIFILTTENDWDKIIPAAIFGLLLITAGASLLGTGLDDTEAELKSTA